MDREADWRRFSRCLKRCEMSLSSEEKKKRNSAFHAKFGPRLQEMGFIKARDCYWRIHGENFVQFVGMRSARNTPAVHFIACGSEWGLSRLAEGVIFPSMYAPTKWYSTSAALNTTLQAFTGVCNRAETVGYGLFDEVDDFYEGLELEYERFCSDAIPLLSSSPSVEDYYMMIRDTIERTRCRGILACIMTNRYDTALCLLRDLKPIVENDEINCLYEQRINTFSTLLVNQDTTAIQEIVDSCKKTLKDDLALFSKKLALSIK